MRLRKSIIFGSIVILLVIIFLVIYYSLNNNKKTVNQTQINQTKQSGLSQFLTKSKKLPQVKFSSYQLKSNYQLSQDNYYQYIFKQPSQEHLQLLATYAQLQNPKFDKGENLIIASDKAGSFINYDLTGGSLFLYSSIGIKSTIQDSDLPTTADQFIKQLGFDNQDLCQFASYQKKSIPDYTFIEYHRCWDKTGLPIINIISLLNVDKSTKLADIKLGQLGINPVVDGDIINTSDGKNGLVRPNEFNSLTLILSNKDNSLISVTSTLRFIDKKQLVKSDQLISPEDAFGQLSNHKATFSLTRPSGAGLFDVNKIYLNNEAISQSATVDDVMLTLIENPSDQAQKVMMPAYIFKGKAKLISGYDIDFIEVVSAVKSVDNQVLGQSIIAQVQNNCKKIGGITYCNIDIWGSSPTPVPPTSTPIPIPTTPPPPTAIPTAIPTIPLPTIPPTAIPPTLTPYPEGKCPSFQAEYLLPNGSKIAYLEQKMADGTPYLAFYYIPKPNEAVDENTVHTVLANISQSAGIDYQQNGKLFRGLCTPWSSPTCPPVSDETKQSKRCYSLSIGSPNIYVYGLNNKKITLDPSPIGGIYYSDPAIGFVGWSIKEDGKRYYYEFDQQLIKQVLNKQNLITGWIFNRNEVMKQFSNVAINLGLNKTETDDLISEINRELYFVDWQEIKISIIDNYLIEKFVPLTIIPKPDSLSRLYFYLEDGAGKSIENPSVSKITRRGLTIIETGVVVGK